MLLANEEGLGVLKTFPAELILYSPPDTYLVLIEFMCQNGEN